MLAAEPLRQSWVHSCSNQLDKICKTVINYTKGTKKIIKVEVEDLLDHKNLNLDIPHFKNLIPSTENLAIFIWNKLRNAIEMECDLSVILYETPRNFVEYSG